MVAFALQGDPYTLLSTTEKYDLILTLLLRNIQKFKWEEVDFKDVFSLYFLFLKPNGNQNYSHLPART